MGTQDASELQPELRGRVLDVSTLLSGARVEASPECARDVDADVYEISPSDWQECIPDATKSESDHSLSATQRQMLNEYLVRKEAEKLGEKQAGKRKKKKVQPKIQPEVTVANSSRLEPETSVLPEVLSSSQPEAAPKSDSDDSFSEMQRQMLNE